MKRLRECMGLFAVLLVVVGCGNGEGGSEPGGGGGGGGVTCGPGTHLDGGVCVVDEAGSGGQSGGAGASGAAGASGSAGSEPGDASDDVYPDVIDAEKPPCTGECGNSICGPCPTVPMIDAEDPEGWKYKIDSRETTVAEYQVFLDANVPKQGDQVCDWNDTYDPDPEYFDFPEPEMPIHAVDWCDAKRYCEWTGKRLCQGAFPEGGPYPGDPSWSEWHNACTAGGTREYPYGDTYDENACPGPEEFYPPGSVPTCEGGYLGLFDMMGNMWEWTYECGTPSSTHPYSDNCWLHGGNHAGSPGVGCSGLMGMSRCATAKYTGIRCCSY